MRASSALRNDSPGDIELSLVERLTGQCDIRSVAAAEAAANRSNQAFQVASGKRREISSKIRRARIAANWLRIRLAIAMLPTRLGLDRWLVAVVASLAVSVVIAGASIMLAPAQRTLILLFSLIPFIAVPLCPFIFPTPQRMSELLRRRQDLRINADWEARKLPSLLSDEASARKVLDDATRLLNGIRQAAAFPLQRLLSIDPSTLDGAQFERYLFDIFTYLRYPVQLVAQSGDQGVDLLVDTATGRVAVQAKCYGGSVGNAAVQQAFAGMVHYRCQRCAVITNSRFTRSAMDLATSTNCRLIDGNHIPQLIRGQIQV